MEEDERSADGRHEARDSLGDPASAAVGPDIDGGEMSVTLSKMDLKEDGVEPRGVSGVRTQAEMAGATSSTVEEAQKYYPEQKQLGPSQGSHRGPYGTGAVDGALDKPLNVMDAVKYLDAVEHKFKDQRDVYYRFLDIMKEFKND